MKFRILGSLTVDAEAGPVDLGPAKQRTVLAALLLEANRIVPVDRLVAAAWEGEPPRSAVANVRTYASRLRKTLRERVESRPPGFVLHVGDDELDLAAFRELAGRGRAALAAGHDGEAVATLGEALSLWRGAAAEDLSRSAGLEAPLAALDEQRLAVLEDWIAARQRLGHDGQLIDELRRLTDTHPLRERLWSQLILARYRGGDIGGALAGYAQARNVLAENLGVDPGPELVRMHQAVLTRDPALDLLDTHPPGPRHPTDSFPRPADALGRFVAPDRAAPDPGTRQHAVPRELPADTSVLVGRDKELHLLLDSVIGGPEHAHGPTVLVLHGPAGIGKSVLAVRAASLLAEHFPDGQLFADLRGTATSRKQPRKVLAGFLRSLGVPDRRIPDDEDETAARYRSITADRRLLILLEDAADEAQVRPLVPAAPGSIVVITARRPLAALDGAAHLHLERLSPDAAEELLVRLCGPERVEAEREETHRLAARCRGLPLALRIAAARLVADPLLPVSALGDHLEYGDLTIHLS
ncbi:AfsR/SARP family transcriptional regulator [Nonomuraea soli]|uniref:DNA-binding SARP family transcriptional activator n=1 Tax=Nonomuraea soli TaxID=1032476 RepID=A0A7W0CKM6_9ACTN|nr:AfsR/SARP family transcriptional regulator [Nonomuraea soli]MBA2892908.1 DNA-binding SARP family transcriptional activator [Nonomuraea soli]